MTDSRTDVHGVSASAPTEADAGHSDATENAQVGGATDDLAAAPGDLAQIAPSGLDTDAGQHDQHQRALQDGSAPADPMEDTPVDPDRNEPDQAVLRDSSVDADPVEAAHDRHDPVAAAPSETQADLTQPDFTAAGQADAAMPVPVPDHEAQIQPAAADSGTPSATGAPAPPLRDPDEAALRLAEAAVFASATPVTPRALSQILPDDLDPAAVIAALQARYQGRGLELCEIGGGLQFRTAPDLAPQLRKVVQVPRRLPRVALETLAIVAYHQPITRPEIEDLRGTGLSQQTLDVLLENDLIAARGRKETPGRPTLWGTTAKFLEYFGLRDIRELPRRQDLLLEAVRPETAAEADPVASDAAQPEPVGAPPA